MKWIKILLTAFICTLILRCCFIESYRMPSTHMENSIMQGDFIFVDKTAYGIRFPSSFPDIPFIPDSVLLFGLSYPTFFNLPSLCLWENPLSRNDVVAFHVPGSSHTPVNRLPVSISRCIGLPGDIVEVIDNEYYINGCRIIQNPDVISSYRHSLSKQYEIRKSMIQLEIPLRKSSSDTKLLSHYENYLIEDALGDTTLLQPVKSESLSYKLQVPHNHYWLLSDNVENSADSRHYGFIPQTHIVGKARLIWMSKQSTGRFFTGYRTDRFFIKVNN